ncbi:MAG TPA: type VI secretion system tip protein TssI/VgrG, partial [Polyangiaceae bacterium]|nr:type VI secretion system tip protein TssI/VgrG [Polyangiaceae bacterium]
MTETTTRLTLAETVLGKEVLKLHSLTGHEALSEPFRFSVTLVTKDDKPIDPAALLGTVVKLTLDKESTTNPALVHPKRYFNGYVTQVSRAVLPSAKWLYTVELRPWLWLLDKTKNCRIFQGLTVPQIVAKVFDDRGFTDFKLKLGKHEKREYCVQYRESDLDFVSRLLEHEGIYYYFEFEADKHILVLTDGTTAHEPKTTYTSIDCGPTFIAAPTVETFGGRIYEWRPQQALHAETFVLKDYDFTKPKANVEGQKGGKKVLPKTTLEKFDYPGGFTTVPVGNDYATLRMQEEQAPCELGEGKATSHGLAPGYVFTMAKNKDAAQNKQYLTTRAEYDLAVSAYEANDELKPRPWTCSFTAIAASTQFRPARVTPRPLIAGLQTAKVVGASADEIHTDVYGRIKVQFHWDREGKLNEKSSCFIRTAQMWAGPSWGSQHLPRVGHEVVVSFLEGDPDQPLIVGSVYNGLNQPPFTLPAQKEVSGVKSKSTLNGGTGYNELSFDDTTGKELINLHAQNNLRAVVEKKRYTEIGGDDTEVVKGTQNIDVNQQFVTVKTTYALRSLVSTELACGPTVIKLTPAGISIMAAKIDITAPVFSLLSATAVVTPALYTLVPGP